MKRRAALTWVGPLLVTALLAGGCQEAENTSHPPPTGSAVQSAYCGGSKKTPPPEGGLPTVTIKPSTTTASPPPDTRYYPAEAGQLFFILDITDDGELLVLHGPADEVHDGTIELKPKSIGVFDGDHVTEIASVSPNFGVAAGTGNKDYIAWIETQSTVIETLPWQVRVTDRRSGKTETIDADLTPTTPNIRGWVSIAVSKERVFWNVGVPQGAGTGSAAAIYSTELGSPGEPRLEVTGALMGKTVGEDLWYTRIPNDAEPSVNPELELHRCAKDGHDVTIGRFRGLQDFSGSASGYCILTRNESDSDTLTIYRPGKAAVSLDFPGSIMGHPSMSDRVVSITDGDAGGQTWYFDLATDELHFVGAWPNYAHSLAGGNVLQWQQDGGFSVATLRG